MVVQRCRAAFFAADGLRRGGRESLRLLSSNSQCALYEPVLASLSAISELLNCHSKEKRQGLSRCPYTALYQTTRRTTFDTLLRCLLESKSSIVERRSPPG